MSVEKLKKITKKILFIMAWVVPGIVFIGILGSSISNHRSNQCSSVSIKIDNSKGVFFIDEKDVMEMVNSYCGTPLKGMVVNKADMAALEADVESNPFVKNAELYSNIKGVINVEIEQKEPLIRVVNKEGVSYYIDRFGQKIPSSSKFTPRVVVASGHLEDMDGTNVFSGNPLLKNLYELALFIERDKFWKAQFEQIYVTEKKEFELVPKLGNHIVLFGNADDMEDKFGRLMIFYKDVLKNVNEDEYKAVNLKFRDQIVCTKI